MTWIVNQSFYLPFPLINIILIVDRIGLIINYEFVLLICGELLKYQSMNNKSILLSCIIAVIGISLSLSNSFYTTSQNISNVTAQKCEEAHVSVVPGAFTLNDKA